MNRRSDGTWQVLEDREATVKVQRHLSGTQGTASAWLGCGAEGTTSKLASGGFSGRKLPAFCPLKHLERLSGSV